MHRRRFIRTLGGAGAVAAMIGALPGCDAMPASAVAPWRGPAADTTDPRVRTISWAILAPNPHNRQPWLVDLRKDGEIALLCDRDRLLPMTDPHSWQILIGHGAFLELLDLAASAEGFRADIAIMPEGPFADDGPDGRPVARIRLARDASRTKDALFDAIPLRRSAKVPYGPRALDAGEVGLLAAALVDRRMGLSVASDRERVEAIRAIALDAFQTEHKTPRALKESMDLLRIGSDEIARNPDGLRIHGASVWWGRLFGVVDRDKLTVPGTTAYDIGLNSENANFAATPCWGWIATPDNSRRTQIEAGRAYARIDLAAARAGIAIHPASQALQDYPEVAPHYERLHRLLGVAAPGRIQMLFRLGRADRPDPSPRRPVRSFMLT